jgi:nitroreductase
MEVIEAMVSRKTKRDFKSVPVSKEMIIKILEAANNTPSSGNSQPWQIYVAGKIVLEKITEALLERHKDTIVHGSADIPLPKEWPEEIQKRINEMHAERDKAQGITHMSEADFRAYVEHISNCCGAPILIVICMDKTLERLSIFSLGMLAQNILLAAHHYGLATFPALSLVSHADIVRRELNIPSGLKIVFGIALGYASDKPINSYYSSRRPIKDFVEFRGI